MSGRKHIAALLGVVVFVGIGAFAASRAQQSTDDQDRRVPNKKALRARIVELRTEIEVLEIEREPARQKLANAIAKWSEFMPGYERQLAYARGEFAPFLALSGADREQGMSEFLKEKNATRRQGEDDTAVILRVIGEEYCREHGIDRAEIDRSKADFVRQTNELNEKRLDLADCEAEYRAAK